MSAPTKSTTGGRRTPTTAASGHSTRGSARSAGTSVKLLAESGNNLALDDREGSRSEATSAPRGVRNSAAAHSKRAEAIKARTPEKSNGRRKAKPRRLDTANSARPRILKAARKTAAQRGYTRLRLCDITRAAEITHQGFYGHFANKRHAVAVATSDELGTIADLATRGSKRDEPWAERLLQDIDRALIEAYPAANGPERWLRDRLTKAVGSEGGYGALRINELIKVSRLGHGEFYRRYGGKRGCLRRIYADVLEELNAELTDGDDPAILGIGRAFAADPGRSKLLVLGATHLPEEEAQNDDAATQGSLPALLVEIAASSSPSSDEQAVTALVGGILEIVRSRVLADRVKDIEADLRMLGPTWGAQSGELAVAA